MSTGQLIKNMIIMILFLIALFIIARGVYKILAWLAPALFILTMVIRFKVVSGFVKTLWNLLNRKPLVGALATVLSIIAFPLVAVVLFGQAVFTKRLDDAKKEYEERRYGVDTDYEEIDSEINLRAFRLPDAENPDKYTDLFDENDRG